MKEMEDMKEQGWCVEGAILVLQEPGTLDLDDERNDGMPPKDDVTKFTLREAVCRASRQPMRGPTRKSRRM